MVFFITYFVIIPTKTYTSLISTYLYPCMIKLRRKSHNLSQKSLFLDVETTFRRTFLCSELQCLPRGDPRTLCKDQFLATHSLPPVFRPLVNKLMTLAYTNSFRNQDSSVNRSDLREREKRGYD